jgi:hypothetical protein
VRLRHDRQALTIALHFALVFPFELAEESVAAHARRVLDAHLVGVGEQGVRTVAEFPA